GGQSALVPLQDSATSHASLLFRQIPPWGANWSGGQKILVPVQVSATSQAPAAARQSAPEFPATCRPTPKEGSHEAAVHGLWSSQSGSFGSFFEHVRAMVQSDGSEFGCCDGYEQTSIMTPPGPESPGARQQSTWASLFRQHVELPGQPLVLPQAFPTWLGSSAKGSEARPTEPVVGQVPSTAFVHLSGRVLPQA